MQYVPVAFWSLFAYDRNLIWPPIFDRFIPPWTNHTFVSTSNPSFSSTFVYTSTVREYEYVSFILLMSICQLAALGSAAAGARGRTAARAAPAAALVAQRGVCSRAAVGLARLVCDARRVRRVHRVDVCGARGEWPLAVRVPPPREGRARAARAAPRVARTHPRRRTRVRATARHRGQRALEAYSEEGAADDSAVIIMTAYNDLASRRGVFE